MMTGVIRVLILVGIAVGFLACAIIPGPGDELDLRGEVQAKLLADIDAAYASALAYEDTLAALCYPVLREWVARERPPIAIKGPISAYERARILRLSIQRGVPIELQIACAPVIRDTETFIRDLVRRGVGVP